MFKVYEERGFMIDERPESDSPSNITPFWRCGNPCAGSCGASDVRFLRSSLQVGGGGALPFRWLVPKVTCGKLTPQRGSD